jgi:hypothetical protein
MDYEKRHKFLRRKVLEGQRAARELTQLVQQQFQESMEKAKRCQDNANKES